MKLQTRLRDLFWVIFVAAVATSWGIDRFRLAQQIKALESTWVDNGGTGTISGFATICCGFDMVPGENIVSGNGSELPETDEECPNPASLNESDTPVTAMVGS